MWSKLQTIISSNYRAELSEHDNRRLVFIIWSGLLLSLTCLILIPFAPFLVDPEIVGMQRKLLLIYASTYIIVLAITSKMKTVEIPSFLFVLNVFLIIASNNIMSGGNLSLVFIWHMLVIIVSVYLTGVRGGVFFLLLVILSVFATNVTQDEGLISHIAVIGDEMHFRNKLSFMTIFIFAITSVIFIMYEAVTQKHIEQIREKEIEVQENVIRKQAIIKGQEEERDRISKELHDGLAQMVVVVNMRMEALKSHVTDEKKEDVKDIQKYLGKIIDETKTISHNLKPFIIDDLGLKVSIEKLVKNSFEKNGIETDVFIDDRLDVTPSFEASSIFRVVQEAFNNILKHSEATLVTLRIQKLQGDCGIVIEDNGKGVELNRIVQRMNEGSSGIKNIEDRVLALNGEFEYFSRPGEGFKVKIKIPCNVNG